MRIIDIESWTDFPDTIAEIRAKFGNRTVKHPDGQQKTLKNDILFRGQTDSEWELKTTLERTTDTRFSIPDYLQSADLVVNEIESLTGTNWQLPSYREIVKEITKVQDSLRSHLPCYEYLVYLRHHGFPSPLLDWTRSPYIAAYFAMEQSNNADRCSVFAFIERPAGGKMFHSSSAAIRSMGSYITTHVRHFAQKSSYTTATQWCKDTKTHYFCSHHFVAPPQVVDQDILIKITIPRTDRISALQQLEDYNINHYTLFQSEDSLVRSLGLRAFELDGT